MKQINTEQQRSKYVVLTPKLCTVGALVKRELTAPELVQAIDVLREAGMKLSLDLVRGCPPCTHCQEDCYCRDYAESVLCDDGPVDEDADPDEDAFGIEDFPLYLLDCYYHAGVCLGALDELLLNEAVINCGK